MHLQPRDIDLFEWLAKYRYLTLPHVRMLGFGASDTIIRRRLRKLEHAGYIGAREFVTSEGRPKYYFLRERAYEHLEGTYRRRRPPKPQFLLHTLDLVTIQIKTEQLFQDHELVRLAWFIPEWRTAVVDGKHVKAIHDKFTTSGQVVAVRPDAAFALEHKAKEAKVLYLIERDRGTEGFRKIKAKLDDYADYARYPERFKSRFKVTLDKFVVLFITTTPKRVANIQQKHRHHAGFKRILLTTLDQFTATTGPSAPIWTREPGSEIGLIRK